MSRAGKFIPGGASRKTTGLGAAKTRTGPIRAPTDPNGEPSKDEKKLFPKSLNKPVPKNRRIPLTAVSAVLCCLLVSLGWYLLAVLPVRRQMEEEQVKAAAQQKAQADELAALQKKQAEAAQLAAAAHATLTLDTQPTGATVSVDDAQKTTPANFTDLHPGKATLLIQSDGYEDYKQDVTLTTDKPVDLGTITLVQKTGGLALTSSASDVTYTLTGRNYTHEGAAPDKLDGLAVGTYQLLAVQRDWKLAPIPVTIRSKETTAQEIKFPYATLSVVSTPPGATVRNGHTILGKTPLSLPQLRPGLFHLSVDLPPYTIQHLDVSLPEAGNVSKSVTLQQEKDFIAACGMPMVWIADGGYWVGKYEVRQSEFETVAAYNPSTFRRATRPVDSISWDNAVAFCAKLTQYELKAGKLPDGYRYTLPTESQWSTFSADADLNQAAMSRLSSLTSTQDVGASEANKYGLYDTLGNVWEWCLDDYDSHGAHSLRGGGWLSSNDNFPSSETRTGAMANYGDKFSGFRVVLVPR